MVLCVRNHLTKILYNVVLSFQKIWNSICRHRSENLYDAVRHRFPLPQNASTEFVSLQDLTEFFSVFDNWTPPRLSVQVATSY
jgi:hypothetical protein